MSTSIVYSTVSGNTGKLAEVIQKKVASPIYAGKIADMALEADLIFVGFWACKFTCSEDVKNFLTQCKNKKIFLFGTAGYDDTQEYFDKILTAVKENIDSSNEIVGEFLSMGKVSEQKQMAIREMDEDKYQGMKANLDKADNHPNQGDFDKLSALVEKALA